MSSVSGGSITNGFVGLKTDLYVAASGDFRTDIGPLAAAVSTRGTLWRSPLTYAYLALLVAILLVATILCLPLEGLWPFVTWVVALAAVGWLARQRGWVAARALDRALFRGAALHRLNPSTDHVICASAPADGADGVLLGPVRLLLPSRVGRAGRRVPRPGRPGVGLPAGSFAPWTLPIEAHRFPLAGAGEDPATRLLLTDGGVSDHLAIDWPLRLADLVRQGQAPDPPPRSIDELVVVNASGGTGATGGRTRKAAAMPLAGEIASLLTANAALSAQVASVGRGLLDARFAAARAGAGSGQASLDGGVVQIDRSPYELPRAFASGSDDLARRARAALDLLTAGRRAGMESGGRSQR